MKLGALSKEVTVKNEGTVHWALKTLIERDPEGGVLKISQGAYALEVIQRFGFASAKVASTPAFDAGPLAEMLPEDLPKNEDDIALLHLLHPFYEAIGCLWWLANISRPDIYLAVQRAAKYVSKPSKKLWLWITRIFRYLKHEPNLGVCYLRPLLAETAGIVPLEVPLLAGSADASFPDCDKKKSTLGQVYWFNGCSCRLEFEDL